MKRYIPGKTLPNKKSRIVSLLRLAQKHLTTIYANTILENPFNIASSDLNQLKSIPGYVNVLELISRCLVTDFTISSLKKISDIKNMKRFVYRMVAVPELDMYSEIEYNLDKAIKLITSSINKIQMTRIEYKDSIEKTLKFIRSKLRKIQ